ncbi:MAG: magnesium transporter [Pseudomonadota bacterium]|nr:magnesium transporter [Pseudomonadota bacterium]
MTIALPDDDNEDLTSRQDEIRHAVQRGNSRTALAIVTGHHPADIAELLDLLPGPDRQQLVEWLRPRFDPEILAYLAPEVRDEVVSQLNPQELAEALGELESDDAVGVLEEIAPGERAEILAQMPEDTRQAVEEGLVWPEYSAGRLMQRDFVGLPSSWTVGQTLKWLQDRGEDLPEGLHEIFTTDSHGRLEGAVPLAHLLRSAPARPLEGIMIRDVSTFSPATGQEEVAFMFRKYGLVSAPVVDSNGHILGVITVDDALEVIEEEAQDDILRLAGVGQSDIHLSLRQTVTSRLRWLAVTLLNTVTASLVIAQFADTIEKIVVLAVLMPIVAAMGGNAGMQAVTVMVRGLAMRDVQKANALRLVGKEAVIGMINGVAFAVILGGLAAVWFHDIRVAGVLALAMTCNMIWAGLAGTIIPLTLDRMGIDPAVAAGPFLTTTTDVLGFLLFLGLATLLLL